jgi:hypothetical protein
LRTPRPPEQLPASHGVSEDAEALDVAEAALRGDRCLGRPRMSVLAKRAADIVEGDDKTERSHAHAQLTDGRIRAQRFVAVVVCGSGVRRRWRGGSGVSTVAIMLLIIVIAAVILAFRDPPK